MSERDHAGQPWTEFVSDADREAIAAAGYGATQGLGSRPAVLVVDVTYAFTGDAPDDLLVAIGKCRTACGRLAWDAVGAIEQLLTVARDQGVPVLYSTDLDDSTNAMGRWASKNTRLVEQAENDAAAGRTLNTIHAQIAPAPGDAVIRKAKPSFFFGTDLVSRLVDAGVDSLLVVGGTTSGCVRATVVDAFSYNYRVAVVADGVFDRSASSQAVTLFDLHAKYADVVSLEEAVDYLTKLG